MCALCVNQNQNRDLGLGGLKKIKTDFVGAARCHHDDWTEKWETWVTEGKKLHSRVYCVWPSHDKNCGAVSRLIVENTVYINSERYYNIVILWCLLLTRKPFRKQIRTQQKCVLNNILHDSWRMIIILRTIAHCLYILDITSD